MFAFLFFALAGIPLTSGFTGKFAVFSAALADGMAPLVVALVASKDGDEGPSKDYAWRR